MASFTAKSAKFFAKTMQSFEYIELPVFPYPELTLNYISSGAFHFYFDDLTQ